MKISTLVTPAVIALALLVGLGTTAQAREIYTWTDKDGVVHYVDTPPDNQAAVSVDVPEVYRPGTSDIVYPETTAPAAAAGEPGEPGEEPVAEALSYADQKRQEMAERRDEQKKQQAEVASACARARQRLAQIEPNRRVFYTDESGETVRMDDEDRVAEVADMRAFLAENCD